VPARGRADRTDRNSRLRLTDCHGEYRTGLQMNFEVRRDAALDILKRTRIRRSNYLPPIIRFLWWLEVKIPLPHFVGFWKVFAAYSVYFVVVFMILLALNNYYMTPLIFSEDPRPLFMPLALGVAVLCGLLVGLGMACYYAYGRRKYQLPRWDNLP
jgi:hypothetical protein